METQEALCGTPVWEKPKCSENPIKLVLPDRIELSTSPLPMECSTTELRQRARIRESAKKGPYKAGRSLPQGPIWRKRGASLCRHQKSSQSARSARGLLQPAQLRANPVPHFLAQRLQRLDRADHDLEFDHFAGLIEFDEIGALELLFADIGGKFEGCIVRAGDKRAMIAKILENSAPPWSAPAALQVAPGLAIARTANGTQYVLTAARPAGRDRPTRQNDASRRCGKGASACISPIRYPPGDIV